MTDGMVITATNPIGTVAIEAGNGTERTFSGKGWKKRIYLRTRPDRWDGSLGMYDPGESSSPYGRLQAEEGILFFSSEAEALHRLHRETFSYHYVFNNQGLVFGYDIQNFNNKESNRNIVIWQVYINGKRPHSLKGADDSAISIRGGSIPDTAKPWPAQVGYDSRPAYPMAKCRVCIANKSVENKPNDPKAHFNRGIAYIYLSAYRDAIKDFNKAIELQPGYAEAYYNRGIAKKSLGDLAGSSSDFQKAKKLGFAGTEYGN